MNATGVNFTLVDGIIQPQVNGPATERMLIIGTAVDGPLNEPIQITNLTTAARLFGPANYSNGYVDPNSNSQSQLANGATIPLEIAKAVAAGCADVWVVRASGNYAVAASAFGNNLYIRSIYPGRVYNGVQVTLSSPGSGQLTVTVNQPSNKGGAFSTTLASGALVNDLIQSIMTNTLNQTIVIDRNYWSANLYSVALTTLGTGTVTLSGGTNGCRINGDDFGPNNPTGMLGYAQLLATTDTGTYDSIRNKNFKFNICSLTGIWVDDQLASGPNAGSVSAAIDFVAFLDAQSSDVGPCHGVMAVRPPHITDDTSLINYCNNNLLATSPSVYNAGQLWIAAGPILYNGFLRQDVTGQQYDAGCRLSVVAGPEAVYNHPDIGTYSDMWHTSYASLLTTLPPENSAENHVLPGIISYSRPFPEKYVNLLTYGVGYSQANNLSGQGAYVTLTRDRLNYNGPLKVNDDPTCTARDDYFRQYQLLHLANNIFNDLDSNLNPFLGGPTSAQAIATMETIVTNILDGYANAGGLKGNQGQGYNFWIGQLGNDADLGYIRVQLVIMPSRALRAIYMTISISG